MGESEPVRLILAVLDELRTVLLDLEIGPEALTTELYTDAVAASRR